MLRVQLLREIIRRLDRVQDSKEGHFRLHYGLRNPPHGRGLGLTGVESEMLILHYAQALEKTYGILAASWDEPKRNKETGRIPVYVFYAPDAEMADSPFTFVDKNGVSFIG